MSRFLIPLVVFALALQLSACGKSQGIPCVDDRTCGVHFRCQVDTMSGSGVCTKCGPVEIPYNCIDDDCDPTTPDNDLDGDGYKKAGVACTPGDDCDDNDPTIHPGAPKNCTNGKDNDCNGMIDAMEPFCTDMGTPRIMFIAPMPDANLAGGVDFKIQGMDAQTLAKIELFHDNSTSLGVQTNTNFAQFHIDTTVFPDGANTFTAVATNIAMAKAEASLSVVLNNRAPMITVNKPVSGGFYGGRMSIDVTAPDPSSVKRLAVLVDTATVATSTSVPIHRTIQTATLSEGLHQLRVLATSTHEVQGTTTVPFHVDRTGPTITIDAEPHVGQAVSGTFSVRVMADDPAGVREVDSNTASVSQSAAGMTLTYAVSTLGPPRIPNGPLFIHATAFDGTIIDDMMTGNMATRTASVIVDNIPPEPVVMLTTPRQGWGVFRSTNIAATVTSPVMTPIDHVEFRVNGRLVDTKTMAPYQTTFDFTRYTGTATITVTAYDAASYMGHDRAVVTIVPPPTFRIADTTGVSGSINTTSYDVGDVNGDGLLDVVTAGSEIDVLTGTITDGHFRFLPGRRVGDSASVVRLANIDTNPGLDIIGLTSSTLSFYYNDPMMPGTFGHPTVIDNGVTSASAMELGDVNHDGLVDVVIGLNGANGGDIRVFLSNNGLFSQGQTFGLVGNVTDIAIGNLNNDQYPDIVVGRSGSAVITSYINTGTAQLYGAGTESYPVLPAERVAIGDMNNDGYPDVVATIPQNDTVVIMTGRSLFPGQFTVTSTNSTIITQVSPSGLALADLNGDGRLDIVVSLLAGDGIDEFFNFPGTASMGIASSYFLRSGSFVLCRNCGHPKLVDYSRDGRLDLIVSSDTDNGIAYARNLGQGNFKAAPTIVLPAAPNSITAGNVAGDPLPDIALTAVPSGPSLSTVHILENRGSSFREWAVIPLTAAMSSPAGIAIGDIDQMGGLDLAIGSANQFTAGAGSALLLFQDATGAYTRRTELNLLNPQAAAIGDVDNDGLPDVVFTELYNIGGQADGAVVVGANGLVRYTLNQGNGASSVGIGQLNNWADNYLDFAVANPATNDVTVNYYDVVHNAFRTITYNTLTNINALTIGRVGNDTVFDIVGVSSQSGVVILHGNMLAGFSSPQDYYAGSAPQGVIGGDFNHDGIYDVMVLNPGSDLASLLIASPQGGFFAPVYITTVHTPTGFVVADFDGDGRPDVAITAAGAPSVMILYANGDRL